MYGDYFEGQRCAEFCLASYKPSAMISGWAPMPDCNEPETVDQFLKLSLMPQSDGPSAQQLIDDSVLVDQTGDGGGYRAPISQALIGPSYSGRLGRKPSSAQQNTFYSSRTGAEFKGHNQLLKNRKWKKRINGSKPLASAPSMPRWGFCCVHFSMTIDFCWMLLSKCLCLLPIRLFLHFPSSYVFTNENKKQ